MVFFVLSHSLKLSTVPSAVSNFTSFPSFFPFPIYLPSLLFFSVFRLLSALCSASILYHSVSLLLTSSILWSYACLHSSLRSSFRSYCSMAHLKLVVAPQFLLIITELSTNNFSTLSNALVLRSVASINLLKYVAKVP